MLAPNSRGGKGKDGAPLCFIGRTYDPASARAMAAALRAGRATIGGDADSLMMVDDLIADLELWPHGDEHMERFAVVLRQLPDLPATRPLLQLVGGSSPELMAELERLRLAECAQADGLGVRAFDAWGRTPAGRLWIREPSGMRSGLSTAPGSFTTMLSSANFAVNCVEGNAESLAKLFPGMSKKTAEGVLLHRHRCATAGNALLVPPDLIVAD